MEPLVLTALALEREEGVEQEREEKEGELEFQPHVDRYIQHLHDTRNGVYDQRLEDFHTPVKLNLTDNCKQVYSAKPRQNECLEQVEGKIPDDHPLRIIAAVLHSAPNSSFRGSSHRRLVDRYASH